mmetsp:Transcript_16637/g.18985  ORF Transcript_16637/g.18985 Transcript_16637/m.18985 type:complete len:100 (+) Transcript_16637:1326-1625(+)
MGWFHKFRKKNWSVCGRLVENGSFVLYGNPRKFTGKFSTISRQGKPLTKFTNPKAYPFWKGSALYLREFVSLFAATFAAFIPQWTNKEICCYFHVYSLL